MTSPYEYDICICCGLPATKLCDQGILIPCSQPLCDNYGHNIIDTCYMPRHITIEHLVCIIAKHDELKNYFQGKDLCLRLGEYYDVLNRESS